MAFQRLVHVCRLLPSFPVVERQQLTSRLNITGKYGRQTIAIGVYGYVCKCRHVFACICQGSVGAAVVIQVVYPGGFNHYLAVQGQRSGLILCMQGTSSPSGTVLCPDSPTAQPKSSLSGILPEPITFATVPCLRPRPSTPPHIMAAAEARALRKASKAGAASEQATTGSVHASNTCTVGIVAQHPARLQHAGASANPLVYNSTALPPAGIPPAGANVKLNKAELDSLPQALPLDAGGKWQTTVPGCSMGLPMPVQALGIRLAPAARAAHTSPAGTQSATGSASVADISSTIASLRSTPAPGHGDDSDGEEYKGTDTAAASAIARQAHVKAAAYGNGLLDPSLTLALGDDVVLDNAPDARLGRGEQVVKMRWSAAVLVSAFWMSLHT